MGQKFFISFNAADQTKAHWIAWTLKEAGHEVAVHDWEIPAGGNAPLWMNTKLAWADRLIAVISPDYLPARYSPVEWASEIWKDPDGTKGSVIPVIVRPTPRIPPLLNDLSRIDLTNCSEAEAKSRLIKGVDMPAPPERKPAFEKIVAEAPDSQHAGPAEKPIFIGGNERRQRVSSNYGWTQTMSEKTGGQSGGVNISGFIGSVGGDIVGGDKNVGVPSAAALQDALRPVIEAIRNAPPEKQSEAQAKLAALEHEAAKGKGADDSIVAKLVDGLVALVPSAASAVVSAFATPILGGIAGPVTGFVLGKLRKE
jgi:hypothetical protein